MKEAFSAILSASIARLFSLPS